MATKQKKKSPSTLKKLNSLKILLPLAIILTATLAGLVLLSYQTKQQHDQHVEQPESRPQTAVDSNYENNILPERTSASEQKPFKQQEEIPFAERFNAPAIAIIMDDLGADKDKAYKVATLDIPITMSIIPNLRYAQETMLIAKNHDREVMVHIPMEPLNYPRHNPGAKALMVEMNDAEIRQTTAYLLSLLPYASGCNNHMGSAFTQHPHQMDIVLQQISHAGLFFIDSLTSAASVAAQQASAIQVPTAIRDVFLDNVREVASINIQLDKLVDIAHKNGSAIGICHPYPETIIALTQFSEQVQKHNITVVPASKLVN